MSGIDKRSDRPVYLQIADELRRRITTGEVSPRKELPSERQLMEQFAAARGTVRQAIAQLVSEGLAETHRGRGTFVRDRPPVLRKAYDRFARAHRQAGKAAYLAEAEAAGRRPEVEVLRVGPTKAPADVAARLGIEVGAQVLERRRRYRSDGLAMETATSYVPWELAKGTAIARRNTGPGGIYARLEENGYRLGRFAEDIWARMPTPEEERGLDLAKGVPVFEVIRVAYTESDQAVELCRTVMPADRWVLAYELPAR